MGIGLETILLTLKRLGNDVPKSGRAQEWLYASIMINFRAVKQLILVSIRVFSILKSPLAEKGTPHLQIFEFHKKSPEIDVSTTDLAALKI